MVVVFERVFVCCGVFGRCFGGLCELLWTVVVFCGNVLYYVSIYFHLCNVLHI